jgi:CubicO group peptidase (beta-lactamase class C family)
MLALAARPAFATGPSDALGGCLAQRAAQDDFSGVVAAMQRGRPIAFLARGQLAGAGSAAITARTRFNLGSASKMFTAVAVGQLIDAGTVRLDQPISAYVSGLTPQASAVTVRQLLTHSSGLGDFFKPQNMAAMMKARTASDLLPLIADDKPAFAPGSRFAYSNSGFALLGILIERVSGLSYGDYLARHVFAPAGMTDTGLDPGPLATLAVGMTAHQPGMAPQGPPGGPGLVLIGPDGRAMTPGAGGDASGAGNRMMQPGSGGHAVAPAEKPTLHPAPGAVEGYGSSAGGMFSTAADMQRFARALLDNQLTRPETTAALTAPQIVAAPATPSRPARRYGFGFGVGIEEGRRWFGHNGGTLGANTEFTVFPEDELTLTVLANRDPPMASDMFAYLRKLALNPTLRASCGAAGSP